MTKMTEKSTRQISGGQSFGYWCACFLIGCGALCGQNNVAKYKWMCR